MPTLWMALLIATAPGDDRAAVDPIAPGIRESQVTFEFDRGKDRIRLRGTVLSRGDGAVTVLTAAHGPGAGDVGSAVRIKQGERLATGRIEAVARNPSYRPEQTEIPGADNAVARFRLDPGGTLDPEKLGTAEPARWAIPEPDGQVVEVQTVDQFGKGHVLKAGNYTNPRWLEWGPIYRPVPGDSGSGVFLLRRRPDGSVAPVLIGAVVDRSTRGGGASLLHLGDRWLDRAAGGPTR